MYNLDERPGCSRSAEDTQLYQVISIDGDRLRYEARTAVGDLYDAFDLRKRPGRPNELIEKIPDTPERRRPAPAPEAAGTEDLVPADLIRPGRRTGLPPARSPRS